MKRKHAIAFMLALVAFVATADVQYLWWEVKSNPVWKNVAGNAVTWTNGNDAVWKSVWNGNATPNVDWTMNSLTFDTATYRSGFWLDGGVYRIGAGGLTFAQQGFFPVGRSSANDRNIRLTASQEWRGTQTGTARSAVSIGYLGWGAYYHMQLGVESSVEWWEISGLLDVWFGGQNNQLGNVVVTVEAPAKIMLVKQHTSNSTQRYPDARLGAEKLILKGDGLQLPTGGVDYPYGASRVQCINTLDAAHIAPALELVDGADLSLTNGLFAIPSVAVKGSGTSEVIGSLSNNLATTSVAFSDGATLFLDADIADGAASPSAISATGYGTLKIDTCKYSATGAVTLGADTTLCLAGVCAPSFQFSGGAAIELDIGTGKTNYLSNAELAAYTGRPVKVKSGTLVLESADSLPAGLSIVEDGGVVAYAASCPLIVTDAVRQEASITVNGGEEMLVFGNGLTSSTALALAGGAVRFMRTATIASPVTVSGTEVHLSTYKNGICGTIAGAVAAARSIKLSGPGRMEFSGGATFSDSAGLYAYADEVELRNGNYSFAQGMLFVGTAVTAVVGGKWVGEWCRRLVVGNGANVTFASHGTSATLSRIKVHPRPDGADYKRESVLEIADGGSVTLPDTSDIELGQNQNIGTLHINGGTLRTGSYGRIHLGCGQYATGRLIIDSGMLRLRGFITKSNSTSQGYVTWNGGTIRIDEGWEDGSPTRYIFNADTGTDTMRISVNVAGEDCVLDLTGFRFASMTNMPPKYNGMFNEWWGHGRLTVKGGKNLVMASIPDGMRLRLEGNGTTVTLPSNGKVYDYDVCATNCQWRIPYGAPSRYNVTNSWLSSMSFANVTLAGTNCAFVCERAETPIYATNVTVAATGVFGGPGRPALPDGTTFMDLEFEDGSTWYLGATLLEIPGKLIFGDSLKFSGAGLPEFIGRWNVAVAADGVVGAPRMSAVGPRRNLRMANEDGTVFVYQLGMVMYFR